MMWYGPGMGGWAFPFMTIGTVLFLALIVVGLVAAARSVRTAGDRLPPARPTPEQVLAERFARGELDDQEYQRALGTLRGARDSAFGS